MGWSKWERHTELKICPECGYSKGLLIRRYTLLGKIIRTQIYCEDCKQIELKKKKNRSPTSLAKRKTQIANPGQQGGHYSPENLETLRQRKAIKKLKGRYAVKRKEYQKRYEYLEEEEAND